MDKESADVCDITGMWVEESLIAICSSVEFASHGNQNQSGPDQAPQPQQPQDLEASDVSAIVFDQQFGIIPIPFQWGKNSLHHSRKSLLRCLW